MVGRSRREVMIWVWCPVLALTRDLAQSQTAAEQSDALIGHLDV